MKMITIWRRQKTLTNARKKKKLYPTPTFVTQSPIALTQPMKTQKYVAVRLPTGLTNIFIKSVLSDKNRPKIAVSVTLEAYYAYN